MLRIFMILFLITIAIKAQSTDHAVPFSYNSCKLNKPQQGEFLFADALAFNRFIEAREQTSSTNDTEKRSFARQTINYRSVVSLQCTFLSVLPFNGTEMAGIINDATFSGKFK